MKRFLPLLLIALITPGMAHAFTVTGRFLYEDRIWDKDGYTGEVQNLPIRRARVEAIDAITSTILASGATDASGFYALEVTGQALPVNLYVRCLTDGRPAGYQIRVVNDFQRNFVTGELVLAGSMLHAITTDITFAHNPSQDLDVGPYVIQDPDGTGVAQAFNIFDNAVDFFDWLAQTSLHGSLPDASQFVVFGWAPNSTNTGSNYSIQGILIASPGQASDTDGWADTVILHETGHWFDDLFSRSDNPGGSHFIGDNMQNPLLSYGEGVATFHCAKVRQFRAPRLNPMGQPIDDHVSIYADLGIPPALPAPGALEFAYDFETGTFNDGTPVGQRGSANETNVTSALWDLVDGPMTPDQTPGIDDDLVGVAHSFTWAVERNYLPGLAASNPVTVEDYFQGWFAEHGPVFLRAGVEDIFVDLALMPFIEDGFEPDNVLGSASSVTPVAHQVATGHVVISELDPGPFDAVELYNATPDPVDLTGWQVEVYRNDITNDPTRVFTFPSFTLGGGEVVVVHEGGDVTQNGTIHLYGGSAQGNQLFAISWFHGGDGACVLRMPDTTPVDFVKWRGVDELGMLRDNETPVPAGTAFTGTLESPLAPNTLMRDVHGTDTDQAADFVSRPGLVGSANHPNPVAHTLFDVGDQDVIAFEAQVGVRYGFESRGPFSATDTRLEILSPTGQVLGANNNADLSVRDSRVDFFASTAETYFVRVTHVGTNTDYGEYELLAFERPVGVTLAAPSSVSAEADNASDAGDPVLVRWLNAGSYDSVAIYRDSVRVATLAGAPGEYTDHANRGLYRYEVSGFVGEQETPRAHTFEFAGLVTCFSADDFEQANAGLWITEGSTWDVTPTHAAGGAFSFTDSPAGTYRGCPTGSGCQIDAIAVFGVPTNLPPHSVLDFDHICITEATFDFGILEVSTDAGESWSELARWDQSAYPEWEDNVAEPGDWKHESLSLAAFAGEQVLVRYRLQSDQLLELDGWYVDNVEINDENCHLLAVDTGAPLTLSFAPPSPNPMRGSARFRFALPVATARVDLAIYDVLGRVMHYERLGPLDAGVHDWSWNGSDESGRSLASGVYFVRLLAGGETRTQKLLKLATR